VVTRSLQLGLRSLRHFAAPDETLLFRTQISPCRSFGLLRLPAMCNQVFELIKIGPIFALEQVWMLPYRSPFPDAFDGEIQISAPDPPAHFVHPIGLAYQDLSGVVQAAPRLSVSIKRTFAGHGTPSFSSLQRRQIIADCPDTSNGPERDVQGRSCDQSSSRYLSG
jgi:hypothetical protein